MPNLEELIEIRNEKIKICLKDISTVENFLYKESIDYYDHNINPELTRQAWEYLDGDLAFVNECTHLKNNYDSLFKEVQNNTQALGFLTEKNLGQYLPNPREIYKIKKEGSPDQYHYVRMSYLQDLAARDGFIINLEPSESEIIYLEVVGKVPHISIPDVPKINVKKK